MIAKGTTHNNGAKLARYLITGKEGETAALWQLRGFAEADLVNAFRSVHVMADATQCDKPFFHVQVRNPVSDRALTRDEWEQSADRIEAKIGYSGQPRAIAFHRDEATGEEHMHIAWSRIDDATMTARPLPFYKLRLKEVSREIEEAFDLTRVKNDRKPKEPRAAKRSEFEQSRRLGVDGKAVRQTIRDCYERSGDGESLHHALDDAGLILARGDRRAFVVIDQAGGIHALNGRILEATAREVAERLADLDRDRLPSVEDARARQAWRRRQGRERGGEASAGEGNAREAAAPAASMPREARRRGRRRPSPQRPRRFGKKGECAQSRPLRRIPPRASIAADPSRLIRKKGMLRKSRPPATPRARAGPGYRKPVKRQAWQPLRTIVAQRAPQRAQRSSPKTYHHTHYRPEIDYSTGKLVEGRPMIQTYHETHYRPQIDYSTGKLIAFPADRPPIMTYHHAHYRPEIDYQTPQPQPQRAGHDHSSRFELYRYHKANGTLHEYFAMFGIDCTPH